jgi:hypothetical protein
MRRQRQRLFKLFLQNTGGNTIVRPPAVPSKIELIGYQYPRMDKYKWQGKV